MMFRITDHNGNTTIEEASEAELLMSMTRAELATLLGTGKVAVPYCDGLRHFAKELLA